MTGRAEAPATPDRTIWTIQYLRGVAALMVVWHHALGQLAHYAPQLPQSNFGVSGVDLFFVISGFIMVLTTHEKQVTPWQFMHRRVIRVVPLYWLLTLAVVALVQVAPALFKTTQTPVYHIVKSLLFIPHFSPAHPGVAWPLIVPGWTLNYEMFFYLVFAASLWLPSRWRLTAVSALMLGLVAWGWLSGPFESAAAQVYTRYLMVEFAIGMWIARWWLGRTQALSLAWSVPLLLVGAVLLFLRDLAPLGEYNQVLGATLVVVGALSPRLLALKSRFWHGLGDASYSTYLTHLFTLGALRVVWAKALPHADGPTWAWAFMALSLVTCAMAGWLSLHLLERPLLRWMR